MNGLLRFIPSEIRNSPLALLFVGAVGGYIYATKFQKSSPAPAAAPSVQDAQAQIMKQSQEMMNQAQDLISSI